MPEHELLKPVQVGAALADRRFPGFLHDDEGENISQKNRSYCELTAQYWAWKNIDADYYGFFHYRRYLYPLLNRKRPYRIEKEPSLSALDKLDYPKFGKLIGEYDLIAPIGENMYVPVREHYANAEFHHRKDLGIAEEIIKKRHPEMVKAMEEYLSGTVCYFGNIYIMRREVFYDYCQWLFPILEGIDRRSDTNGYDAQEKRVDGYLAERLFGVYFTWRKDRLKTLEVPRVHFISDGKTRVKQKMLNTLLPVGSRVRSVVKQYGKRSNAK